MPSGQLLLPPDTRLVSRLDKRRWRVIRSLQGVKFARAVRSWFGIWVFDSLTVYVARENWQALIIWLAMAWGGVYFQGADAVPDVAQDYLARLHPLWWVVVSYLAVNAVVALWKMRKSELAKGQWIGTKFLYSAPQIALTTEWTPQMNGGEIVFKFRDAEPLSLVQYKVEFDGAQERIWGMLIGLHRWTSSSEILQTRRVTQYGKATIGNDKKLALRCYSMPGTVPNIVRVYILSWEVNALEAFEFTSEGTRCVVKVPTVARK